MMSRTRVAMSLLLAGSLLLVACSHQSAQELGLKRIDLDLAFRDPSKAKPPTITQIVQTQQLAPAATAVIAQVAAEQPLSSTDLNLTLPPARSTDPFACATAPAGAKPATATAIAITTPPAVGTYLQHNTGTFSLAAGPLQLAGPVASISSMDIANVKTVPVAGGSVLATAPSNNIDFDVIEHSSGSTVTKSYQATSTELDLVQEVTVFNGQKTTFTPTPPVTIMQFKGVNSTGWTSAGIDQSNGMVMTVQGSVTDEEAVDVCGTMYDAWKVVSNERILNVGSSYSYQTDSNDPNTYDFANQFGGLLIRFHEHSTTAFTVNGIPTTLNVNYTSTVNSVTPRPAESLGG